MGLLKTLGAVALVTGFAYCGATVPLGERTFFGHVQQIWASDETQDLVDGVQQASDPLLERIERGVKAGMQAATAEPDGGTHDAEAAPSRKPSSTVRKATTLDEPARAPEG